MGYRDFVHTDTTIPTIQHSPSESQWAGLSIGRLNCPLHTDWRTFNPATELRRTNKELVVMRYSTAETYIAEQLVQEGLTSWIADTLIYFSLNVDTPSTPQDGLHFEETSGEDDRLMPIIKSSFQHYTNHYAANRRLRDLPLDEAYFDWITSTGADRGDHVYLLLDNNHNALAFASTSEVDHTTTEWTLSGVHPDYQGKGVYQSVIAHLAQMTRSRGQSTLVTSTQASNVPSMRGFIKGGFLPEFSLNTLHIAPRESTTHKAGSQR